MSFPVSVRIDPSVRILTEFIEDTVAFCRMFYGEGVACFVHGEELQGEMMGRYPQAWMMWLFDEIGWYAPYPYPPTKHTLNA